MSRPFIGDHHHARGYPCLKTSSPHRVLAATTVSRRAARALAAHAYAWLDAGTPLLLTSVRPCCGSLIVSPSSSANRKTRGCSSTDLGFTSLCSAATRTASSSRRAGTFARGRPSSWRRQESGSRSTSSTRRVLRGGQVTGRAALQARQATSTAHIPSLPPT